MKNIGLWINLFLQAIAIFFITYVYIGQYSNISAILGLILAGATAGIEYGIYSKK